MPGPHGFPRNERLTRRSEFVASYREGRRHSEAHFVCYVVRREGQGRKVGFSVSRKVGNAVTRNRVKRYLREAYRAHRRQLPEDATLVFVALPGAATLDYWQSFSEIQRLLVKGKLLDG